MAKYVEYKKRRFPLRKEANDWAQSEKSRVNEVMKIKIDINYHPNQELPWEAVLLARD
jgi:hypothetical protein